MYRDIVNFSKNKGFLYHIYKIYKQIVLLILLASAMVGCSSNEDSTSEKKSPTLPNDSANDSSVGTLNTNAGSSGLTDEGNAGSSGSSEPEIVSASGINPDDPCSNPTITTPEDMSSLAGCTTISGDLEVPEEANEVSDLSGLANVETVEGDVKIRGPKLTSLQGLNNLSTIGGNLTISTPALTTLTGLDNLVSVGALYLFDCSSLTDLNGLGSLTSVEGELSITNSPGATSVLSSLEGFTSLTSVGKLRLQRMMQVPTCEAYDLCDRLGLSRDDSSLVIICENAQDSCSDSTNTKCTIIT